jgi:hypothetical protein
MKPGKFVSRIIRDVDRPKRAANEGRDAFGLLNLACDEMGRKGESNRWGYE